MSTFFAVATAFILFCFQVSALRTAFHVDPITGDDIHAVGSSASPFKTLAAAQAATHDTFPFGVPPELGVEIVLHKGVYDVSKTPLVVRRKSSGVSFVNAPGEVPELYAGVELNPSDWFVPEEYPELLAYDLTALVGLEDLGSLSSGGLGDCANAKAEIFAGGQPLWLARYPNVDAESGLFGWNNITSVCDDDPCLDSFAWNEMTKVSEWANASDLWLHGYWSYDWADNHIRISEMDATTGTFYADPSTPPVYGFKAGARWYAENLLGELDSPDEYFIDFAAGVAYVSRDIANLTQVVVSIGSSALVVEEGTRDVAFSGLTFSYAQGTLVSGTGLENVTFEDCTLANGGSGGLSVQNSADVSVARNQVRGLGCSGVSLGGGDRASLTHGNLRAVDNTIAGYARWKRTYQPGVAFSGVGVHVLRNDVSGAPHQGMSGSGNEHLLQGNRLHDLCFEASDSGALYVGRSWSQRGNAARDNEFVNVRPLQTTVLGVITVSGVYLDDQMSGWEVANNSFTNVMQGILVGGGRHNVVENNSFTNCDTGIALDNRGLTWQTSYCAPGGTFQDDLESFNYQADPWASRYPLVVNTYSDQPCTPVHNSISHNRYCGMGEAFGVFYSEASATNTIEDNLRASDCTSDDDQGAAAAAAVSWFVDEAEDGHERHHRKN